MHDLESVPWRVCEQASPLIVLFRIPAFPHLTAHCIVRYPSITVTNRRRPQIYRRLRRRHFCRVEHTDSQELDHSI